MAGLSAALLGACATGAPEAPAGAGAATSFTDVASRAPTALVAHEATARPDCYTVDIYPGTAIVQKGEGAPDGYRDYLGRWGAAAWDGVWCHDLHVLDVRPDGAVTVIEAHAPYPEWGRAVSAYRRTGHFDDQNRLHLSYGPTEVVYWLEDGMLYGVRAEGDVERRIAMTRKSRS